MGGKVQAMPGFADHVVFLDKQSLHRLRGENLHRHVLRPGHHAGRRRPAHLRARKMRPLRRLPVELLPSARRQRLKHRIPCRCRRPALGGKLISQNSTGNNKFNEVSNAKIRDRLPSLPLLVGDVWTENALRQAPRAKRGVDYPLKVHVSGIHIRTYYESPSWLGPNFLATERNQDVAYADAVLNGKKIELLGGMDMDSRQLSNTIVPGRLSGTPLERFVEVEHYVDWSGV